MIYRFESLSFKNWSTYIFIIQSKDSITCFPCKGPIFIYNLILIVTFCFVFCRWDRYGQVHTDGLSVQHQLWRNSQPSHSVLGQAQGPHLRAAGEQRPPQGLLKKCLVVLSRNRSYLNCFLVTVTASKLEDPKSTAATARTYCDIPGDVGVRTLGLLPCVLFVTFIGATRAWTLDWQGSQPSNYWVAWKHCHKIYITVFYFIRLSVATVLG